MELLDGKLYFYFAITKRRHIRIMYYESIIPFFFLFVLVQFKNMSVRVLFYDASKGA